MKTTYDLGIDANQVKFRVTVGTTATAYTSVYLARMGGQQTKIAESGYDSGNIGSKNLGNAAGLRNHFLAILTSLDLTNIDPALWEGQIDLLDISYELTGGFGGTQVFRQDKDDMKVLPGGKVLITKPIELL
jgi:hypothetical protein